MITKLRNLIFNVSKINADVKKIIIKIKAEYIGFVVGNIEKHKKILRNVRSFIKNILTINVVFAVICNRRVELVLNLLCD